jgi:AraC-like DNA-binding protein
LALIEFIVLGLWIVMGNVADKNIYILTSWVNALLAGLRADGCDDMVIVSHSGVDPKVLESGYCSLNTITAIFESAQTLYGDYAGISSNKGVTPSSFRSLSIALLASDTLADSFSLLVNHNAMITNAMNFIVDSQGGGRFGFAMQEGVSISLPLASVILGRALRTASFIHPCSKLINKVEMSYEKPINSVQYDLYFDAPVTWGSPHNVLYFDERVFNCLSTQANPELKEIAEKTWLKEVSEVNEFNFVLRVTAFLKANLSGSRLTIENTADEFKMSVRTFQRRLDLERTSFRTLVDFVRKNEGQKLIKNTGIPLTEVAYSLGFSDSGSFSRAFRRWFELSPEQFRKHHI